MNYCICSLALSILIATSCTTNKETKEETKEELATLFSLLSPEKTGVDFKNEVQNQTDFNIFKSIP